MRLFGRSFPGLRPSFTALSDHSPQACAGGTSLGVSRPFSALRRESPRSSGLPVRGPGRVSDQDFAGESHLARYGAAPRLSQPFSGLVPLSTVSRFSREWHSWDFPFRGFILPQSLDDSSPPNTLMTLFPRFAPLPFLGGSFRGRVAVLPRTTQQHHCWFASRQARRRKRRLVPCLARHYALPSSGSSSL
jgi:hypothetical protein